MSLTEQTRMTERTEKRIDDNKDGGNADTMNGATDNTGQTNTAR